MRIVAVSLVFLAVLLSGWGFDPRFLAYIVYLGATILGIVCLTFLLRNRLGPHGLTWIPVSIAMLVSIGLTNWPLRLSFAYIRPRLEAYIWCLKVGDAVPSSIHTGIFDIIRVEQRDGGYLFWLSDTADGGAVFVKGASLSARLNEWSSVHLADNWWYVFID